jgi:hypothetical protein
MQLPRGTFREIKKSTEFGGLLEELQQMRFTGICTISHGSANGIIVFKSGKRILAEYEKNIGDAAWDKLQNIVEETVGAVLSTLDEAQIQLSLEFNKSCRILNVGKAEQPPPPTIPSAQPHGVKKSPLPCLKPEDEAAVKNNLNPVVPESTASGLSVPVESHHTKEPSKKTVHTHSAKTSHKHPAAISPQSKGYTQSEGKKEIPKDEKSPLADTNSGDFDKDIDAMDPEAVSSFDRDIDTFETMDLEAITNKIRIECKDIIKQLNLEHLKEN